MTKAHKVSDLRSKRKQELLDALERERQELSTLHVAKITGGAATKIAQIGRVRKNIARILTVHNQVQKEKMREEFGQLKYVPRELRSKRTRAKRRQLSATQRARRTVKQQKTRANAPRMRYYVRSAQESKVDGAEGDQAMVTGGVASTPHLASRPGRKARPSANYRTLRDLGSGRAIFERHDTNGNGRLEMNEIAAVARELGHILDEDELRLAVAELGGDSGDSVSFEDFLVWWQQPNKFAFLSLNDEALDLRKAAAEVFQRLDENSNNVIDGREIDALHAELTNRGLIRCSVTEMMLALDSNRDGRISFNELIAWISAQSTVQRGRLTFSPSSK